MAELDEIVITLVAETSRLRAELSTATKVTQQSAEKMEKAIKDFSENSAGRLGVFDIALGSLIGHLGSEIVTKGFELLAEGAKLAAEFLVEGAHAAIEQEQAFTRLANGLALSGHFSIEAQKSLQEFADEMEATTGVEDHLVASSLAVLSSITRLSSEGLIQAQKAAIDLSAALGIDLDSATRLVGKGIEGSFRGFQQYGIQVKEGANASENLANILEKLSNVNGAAEGAFKTFGGSIINVKNQFGNLFEEIARSVTSNPVVIASIGEIAKIFHELTESAKGSSFTLREGVANAFLFVVDSAGFLVTSLDILLRAGQAALQPLIIAASALGESILYVKNIIAGTATDDPFATTKESFQALGEIFTKDTALGSLAEKIAQVGQAGEASFNKVYDAASTTLPTIHSNAEAVKELTAEEKARQDVVKSLTESLAEQNLSVTQGFDDQAAKLQNSLDLQLISQQTYFDTIDQIRAEKFAAEQQALDEALAAKLVSESQYQAAKTQLATNQALEEQKALVARNKFAQDSDKERAANLKSTFATIATLSEANNAGLAAIGKAAAITTATIDGIVAVQKALASAPPPFNFALAALVGAATAVNVAKIAGVPLATGITEVPRSAGGGNSGDNFAASLSPGERVVDSDTNQDLKAFLAANQGGASGRNVQIHITVDNRLPASREAGNAIIEAINDSLAAGGIRILGTT